MNDRVSFDIVCFFFLIEKVKFGLIIVLIMKDVCGVLYEIIVQENVKFYLIGFVYRILNKDNIFDFKDFFIFFLLIVVEYLRG